MECYLFDDKVKLAQLLVPSSFGSEYGKIFANNHSLKNAFYIHRTVDAAQRV